MNNHKILIIDDDDVVREYFHELLVRRGFKPSTASGGLDGVAMLARKDYDIVFLDIRMPDLSGHEVLKRIMKISKETVVIMASAYQSIPDAVKSIRDGAYDYLPKPFKERNFDLLLNRAIEHSDLLKENKRLKARETKSVDLIGKSPALERIREIVKSIAETNVTVLITGKSGTGKEIISRMIHNESNRRDFPFIRINCAALPDSLLESELFGYEKGAFTGADRARAGKFEAADKGTILLDEISETSQAFQVKLLRVIQERELSRIGSNKTKKIDTRIIATSNRDLPQLIKENKFREDLYFRLNVIPIHIPPLSERKEDIPFLVDYFLKKFSLENGKKIIGFSRDALRLLRQYSYPGNARELQNIIERAVVLTSGEIIEPQDLAMDSSYEKSPVVDEPFLMENITLAEMEKRVILAYLRKTGGNRSQVARILNVSVRTIRNKLIDYRKEGIIVNTDGIATYTKKE